MTLVMGESMILTSHDEQVVMTTLQPAHCLQVKMRPVLEPFSSNRYLQVGECEAVGIAPRATLAAINLRLVCTEQIDPKS